MTTETTSTEPSTTTEITENNVDNSLFESLVDGQPKLWAGKYKTVEDLEEAYKKTAKLYQDYQVLQKQVEVLTKAPDDYDVPTDVVMRGQEIEGLKLIAKNAVLTQEQFNKTARDMQDRVSKQNQAFEDAKKSIGDEKLIVLEDYVKKNYPAKLHEHVLIKLIKDKEAMNDALKDRDARLNSQAPGMSQAGGSVTEKFDGERELKKAAHEYSQDPRDPSKKRRYIELAKDVGHARGLGQGK